MISRKTIFSLALALSMISVFTNISTSTALGSNLGSKTDATGASVLEIHHINVGEGTAVLIRSPSGKDLLYGAGGDGQGIMKVLPYLADRGIDGKNDSLDYLISPNYHEGSIGGLDEVVYGLDREPGTEDDMDIHAAYDRGWQYNSRYYNDYARAVENVRVTLNDSEEIDMGSGVTVKVVAVNGNGVLNSPYNDPNRERDYSIALLVKYGGFRYLATGDLSKDVEFSLGEELKNMNEVPVNVYLAGNHGDKNSSSKDFITIISPAVSIISSGQNSVGHPNPGVISRLSEKGTVYQTRFQGDIVVKSDGSDYWVEFPPMETDEINVYFARNVDHDFAIPGGVKAVGASLGSFHYDVRSHFIDRINATENTIDMCFCRLRKRDFGEDVYNEIKAAADRGVKIRIIVDMAGWDNDVAELAQYEGISIQHDGSSDYDYDMHNKFAIFDNQWVWNSSAHWVTPDPGHPWADDWIEVHNEDLARAFAEEFELMWGDGPVDNAGTPSPSSLFGEDKEGHELSQNVFVINGRLWELYPSPRRGATRGIIKAINMTYPGLSGSGSDPFGYGLDYPAHANHEVFFALSDFTFTPDFWGHLTGENILGALEDMWVRDNIDIRGMIKNYDEPYSVQYPMKDQDNPPGSSVDNQYYDEHIRWRDHPNDNVYQHLGIHHKYAIVDGFHMNSVPAVIAGSMAWSKSGDTWNNEMTLIIYDPVIANQYLQAFVAKYNEVADEPLVPPSPTLNSTDLSTLELDYTETSITLYGEGFVIENSLAVQIGDTYCEVDLESSTSTEIVAIVPEGVGPGTYDIVVTNPSGWQARIQNGFVIKGKETGWMLIMGIAGVTALVCIVVAILYLRKR